MEGRAARRAGGVLPDLRVRQLVATTCALESGVGRGAEPASARRAVVTLDTVGLRALTLLRFAVTVAAVVLITAMTVFPVAHDGSPGLILYPRREKRACGAKGVRVGGYEGLPTHPRVSSPHPLIPSSPWSRAREPEPSAVLNSARLSTLVSGSYPRLSVGAARRRHR